MKKIFTNINFQLGFLILISIFLFAFTKNRNNERKVLDFKVNFKNPKNFFMDYEMVNKLLIENNWDTINLTNKTLNLEVIENLFDKHPMIEESEIYKNIDGTINLVITQKTPIARVFKDNNSYYLCKNKSKMPLSEINSERLIILTGKIYDSQIDSLYFLLNKINNDKTLKENLISIEMGLDKNLTFKNRVYDYTINFGRLEDINQKLTNYKIFILKMANTGKLEKYKNVNLKFSKQVICNE
jgi:cell division protein FtsQ